MTFSKEDYLVKQDRKKILLLSDDIRTYSGVGTMSKEIVFGTAHRFNWVQLGAMRQHPDHLKMADMCQDVIKETGVPDPDVRVIGYTGYGDMQVLRYLLDLEKPDAIMIFTDPRYWTWLFNAEREIRSQVPIIYLNIWDDLPYPMWNKPYYESCDGLLAISKQTKNINIQVLGDDIENHIIRYVPHGVSSKYKPLAEDDEQLDSFKQGLWPDGEPEFKLLYNARNMGRKRVADIILAWRHFCDLIGKDKAKECELIMHTAAVDPVGTDLAAIYRDLCDPSYVKIRFLENSFNTETMNLMYNAMDGTILVSSNEGWGLSLTESLLAGKMIIASVSGGMQDQMRFEDEKGNWIDFSRTFPSNHTGLYKKHGEWAIPVFTTMRSICGSVTTPYVFEDKSSIEDISNAILELYSLSPEERARRGMKGHDWAVSDEAGFTSEKMASRMVEGIEATMTKFKEHPRESVELFKIEDRPSTLIDYDPISYNI